MATLYRKYRPQAFNEVVGQNHIKLALEYELKSNQLAHSYLFCGPRAVGKTTLARVLAKSLNCLNRPEGSAEPCNECSACQEITKGSALDIIEIDAASHTGVDNVRENIIAGARIAPSVLKYKVFIIDEVHMLSTAAFNALLKIMEEPPAFVVFVLCTTEVHKIPSTIISRCQRFDFKKISVTDIVHKLEYILKAEGISADRTILENIARYSGGHMRDAESILGQIVSLAETPANGGMLHITTEQAEMVVPRNNLLQAAKLIDFLAIKDGANAIRLVNVLVDDGYDLKIFINDTIELLRQLLLIKVNPELIAALGVDFGETLTNDLLAISGKINTVWLLRALNGMIAAKNGLRDAVLGQLPIEMAIVDITEAGDNNISSNAITQQVQSKNAPVAQIKPQAVSVEAGLELSELLARWPEIISNIKQNNNSLFLSVKMATPSFGSNGALLLTFKHKLHKDRVADPAMKVLLEQIVETVYNRKLLVDFILDDASGMEVNNLESLNIVPEEPLGPEATMTSDPVIDEVLKNFGGRIVG